MRKGEILSLTWENVHLGKRYVHLPDTENGYSRDVSLSPQALEPQGDLPRNIRSDQVVFPPTLWSTEERMAQSLF